MICMSAPWNVETVKIDATKHFAKDYMRMWGWTIDDVRDALRVAYKIEKTGRNKFEIYTNKSGYKKVITAYVALDDCIICISGAEGGKRK